MILVVTHEVEFGHHVAQRMREEGHEVSLVFEGRQALRFVSETPPALIFLDLYLKNPSGLEVLRLIREQGFKGKVILLAGVSVSTLIPQAYQLGVDQVIGGPLEFGPLDCALHAAIGSSSPIPPSKEKEKPCTRI